AVPGAPVVYTLSLHDALPISGAMFSLTGRARSWSQRQRGSTEAGEEALEEMPIVCRLICTHEPCCFRFRPLHGKECAVCRSAARDRKSTRLNSSHLVISYAVF